METMTKGLFIALLSLYENQKLARTATPGDVLWVIRGESKEWSGPPEKFVKNYKIGEFGFALPMLKRTSSEAAEHWKGRIETRDKMYRKWMNEAGVEIDPLAEKVEDFPEASDKLQADLFR